jgi:hydrogenase nickel incorporation protein HypA/HybF
MHEFDICERLFDLIAEQQASRPFTRVKRVRVDVGFLSSADTEALASAFDIMIRGTPLDGAILQIERMASLGDCLDCGAEVTIGALPALCPHCGGTRLRPAPGNSTRFVEIEVV